MVPKTGRQGQEKGWPLGGENEESWTHDTIVIEIMNKQENIEITQPTNPNRALVPQSFSWRGGPGGQRTATWVYAGKGVG